MSTAIDAVFQNNHNGSDSDENVTVQDSAKISKKRKVKGRMCDAAKKMRECTFETGQDCLCKRYECFKNINSAERACLIKQFNDIGREGGTNAQNAFLSGLISLQPVAQRRPRKNEKDARFNDSSYTYKVRVVRDGLAVEVPVCFKGFQALFGIKPFRLHTIKTSLRTTGKPPIDGRGKHSNRPHKLSENTRCAVMSFFGSLKGRKAHYSLKDSEKVYLPAESNIKELLGIFLNKHPGLQISYETFRHIFVSEFNIGFGYPRTDTCCFCDEQQAKITDIKRRISNTVQDLEKSKLLNDLKQIEIANTEHLKKAQWFYTLKKSAKTEAKQNKTVEAIAIDFGRNLPTPNTSSSEVYFRRQLTFYIFNVHILSTGESIMYTYDQTVGKKGCNDVASMLLHFFKNYLDKSVTHLNIFADSCGGQNKNHTIIKFLHYVTSELKMFEKVVVTYPVRGHSYMESDKNMALIPKSSKAETPAGWREVIEGARAKPSPFVVVACDQEIFKNWGDFLQSKGYKKSFVLKSDQSNSLGLFK